MVAFCGVLLLCGVVLFFTDFFGTFTIEPRKAALVAGVGLGVCALLLIGFFVL